MNKKTLSVLLVTMMLGAIATGCQDSSLQKNVVKVDYEVTKE